MGKIIGVDKPNNKDLPYGVYFDEENYQILTGDEIQYSRNISDGSLVYTNREITQYCLPGKKYKVWYSESQASDSCDSTIHRYVIYIEDFSEWEEICKNNETINCLFNEMHYYCDEYNAKRCIIEAFEEGKKMSEKIIDKILDLSAKYDKESMVDQFDRSKRIEYIKKHLIEENEKIYF